VEGHAGADFRVLMGPVNGDGLAARVDQPAEFDTVGEPLLHLGVGLLQTVSRREELDDELRAERALAEAIPGGPGGVGR